MTALFIALCLCQVPPSNPIVKLTHTEIVRKDGNPWQINSLASGVVVYQERNEYTVLTCAHGKRKGHAWNVTLNGRSDSTAGVVTATDYDRDLALITFMPLQRETPRVMRIGHHKAGDGDLVRIMGYGQNKTRQNLLSERTTHVFKYEEATIGGNTRLRIRTKGRTNFGDSGGALVQNGELVGIVNGFSNTLDVDGYFVTLEDVTEFLKENGFEP